MSEYYRESLRIREEQLRIANDLVDFKNECLQRLNKKLERLEKENKALRLQSDIYFEEWQDAKKRIEELEEGERD